ncbi:hypothetical protein F5I97DRAFT_605430 [Phlebopus sp. FC_14]|nr:hypothetical protein F5I97DRAFT_605430 [Phlebopus sp. FC_14]
MSAASHNPVDTQPDAQRQNDACSTPIGGLRKATSKFKPATSSTSGSSSISLRSKVASASASGLPVFSTPGFSKKATSTDAPMSAPPLVHEIVDLVSEERDMAGQVPRKRLSSDFADLEGHPSSSKRFKSLASMGKEHRFRSSPSKGKEKLRHLTPDRREASSDGDSLNLGPSEPRLPSDPSTCHSPFIPPTLKHPSQAQVPRSPQKNSSGELFIDLNSKSLDALRSLLTLNQGYRSEIGNKITSYVHKAESHDIVLLSLLIDQTDARIGAINDRITALDAQEAEPAMLPLRSSVSNIRSSVNITEPPVHVPAVPPPSSMATSDSTTTMASATSTDSNTTVGPTSLDTNGIMELDSVDTSAHTLVVPDSDDKLYDAFDDFSPDDIEELAAEKPSASTSAAVRIDHTASPYYEEVISVLKKTFKLTSFRRNQLECIIATLDARDVFYLAPTGGGKSLCYQLPALCTTGKTQGTTFVISPLLSLITDQVSALRSKGINAWCLSSGAAELDEIREVMRRMQSGDKPRIVYTTPEKLLASDRLQEVVDQLYKEGQLARFVIDEAHVIGSWGRDFRASYGALHILRDNWSTVPIMALTGSANKNATEDIKQLLGMRDPVCLAQSFNRPNLHYGVRAKPKDKKILFQEIAGFIKSQHSKETGIIYCLSRDDCEEMAEKLREAHGLSARHYHAGMNPEEKRTNQDDWSNGRCQLIVATIAFGMGVDKPDVRFVIHATMSKDMDGYYQETGRAGRDGQPSDCLLFYAYADAMKLQNMLKNPSPNDPRSRAPDGAEIQRQIEKLSSVAAFCSNEADCRRVLLLRHFDESFDETECHKGCDNCCKPGTVVTEDCTVQVQEAIRLFEQMSTVSNRVTPSQLRDVWRGSKKKSVTPFSRLSLYGAGQGIKSDIVDRLLDKMYCANILSTYRVSSPNGFGNNYLELGSAAQQYLHSNAPFTITYKVAENSSKLSSRPSRGGPLSEKRKGKEVAHPREQRQYQSLYQDDIEDADSDFNPIGDDTPQASSSRTTIGPRPGIRKTSDPDTLHPIVQDNPTSRLERLEDERRKLSINYEIPEDEILLPDALETIALVCPTGMPAVRPGVMNLRS